MIPKDLTADIRNRLKSIEGQVNGIVKMLDEERDPEDILLQFKATLKGLEKAQFLLLDEVYRKALAIKIVNLIDACPGNCGYEGRIEFIKDQFPDLGLDELSAKLRELKEIEERVTRHNNQNNSQEK